jgi:ubiquinone/menaquinone biosynthesis C-methylase UbiE
MQKKQVQLTQKKKNEISHFSELPHIWWGARTIAGKKRYLNKLQKLKEYVNLKSGSKVLEIGCGDGEFTKLVAKLNSHVIATDITPTVIKRAKARLHLKNVRFMVDDSEKLSFPTKTFDLVCGVSILHHIDTRKALEESFRVLKKGGRLFFTEPNLINPNIWIGLHTPGLREKMEYSPDETALIRWEIEKMLQSIGFSKYQVVNYDFLHPLTPPKLVPLLEKIGPWMEKIPLIKEISGSLIVYAEK